VAQDCGPPVFIIHLRHMNPWLKNIDRQYFRIWSPIHKEIRH
jgi:hypothetical protein